MGLLLQNMSFLKEKKDDSNNLYVEYTENTRPINMPPDTKLYHQSVVGGIKELIPDGSYVEKVKMDICAIT